MFEAGPERPLISRRELEVARAYTSGKTYRQIADDLHIAPATVRTHINNIYRKLGVSSKIELLHNIAPAAPIATPVPPRKRQITAIAGLGLAALAGAFMVTTKPTPAPSVPVLRSLALVTFRDDGSPTTRDTLVRDMVDTLSRRTELFVIIPSNSQLTLSPEHYARRLSDGINTRFVLTGKTASRGEALVVSASLYDRLEDQIIWQDEVRSTERNSLAIRVSLQDSLTRAVHILPAAPSQTRCLEMIESDTHVFRDGAPAPTYLYQGQNHRYCGVSEAGPR